VQYGAPLKFSQCERLSKNNGRASPIRMSAGTKKTSAQSRRLASQSDDKTQPGVIPPQRENPWIAGHPKRRAPKGAPEAVSIPLAGFNSAIGAMIHNIDRKAIYYTGERIRDANN
jgi:hypothetical protein